jgi:F0F1-type ATP synthase membrane subunit b/b'
MSPVSLIPSLQSDALVREIEQQLAQENGAIAAGAQRDARAIMAQARAAARLQVHAAIQELREEGARRLTRAEAQLDTELRARAQHQAAQAVRDAVPLLREALSARWRDRDSRKLWTEAVALSCTNRLPPGAWCIEHPRDWNEPEQKQFITAVGKSVQARFEAADHIAAGLRVSVDQALLDATPHGLLADSTTIAALLLDEIGAGS